MNPDRHRNRDAAWWRAYRLRRGDSLRRYKASFERSRYVKHPRMRLRQTQPNAQDVAAVQAARLALTAARIEAERVAALLVASANEELAQLIRDQTRDARQIQVKFGPEFDDSRAARLVA